MIYAELSGDDAKKVVEGYHKEAKAAGVQREREKRERSPSRDGPAAKRQRDQDKRGQDRRRDRDFGRDRQPGYNGES